MAPEQLFEQWYMSTLPKRMQDHHRKFNHEGMPGYDHAKAAFLAGIAAGEQRERDAIIKIAEMLRDNKMYGPPDAQSAMNDLICAAAIRGRK